MQRSIYFDYNATTPLDPAVRAAMLPFFDEIWGNPSSIHHLGRKARSLLDEARERAAGCLGAKPSEIVFTSGGSEANNLAIFGTARLLKPKGRHLITSSVEHHAVLHCFDYLEKYENFTVTRLPVDHEGRINLADLKAAFRPDTVLVSVMAANNEIGTLQPVAEAGALCRERGVIFHTDAVQWFGKQPFNDIGQFNADLVSLCAHKFHGPRGAGILYIRSPLHPHPILFGGAHENERRAGTENLPAIMGLVSALELFVKSPVFVAAQLEPMKILLNSVIRQIPGCEVVSPAVFATPFRLPWTALMASGCSQGSIWRAFVPRAGPLAQRVPWNPATSSSPSGARLPPTVWFDFHSAGLPRPRKWILSARSCRRLLAGHNLADWRRMDGE